MVHFLILVFAQIQVFVFLMSLPFVARDQIIPIAIYIYIYIYVNSGLMGQSIYKVQE